MSVTARLLVARTLFGYHVELIDMNSHCCQDSILATVARNADTCHIWERCFDAVFPNHANQQILTPQNLVCRSFCCPNSNLPLHVSPE
jgi:hypothetical protein